jgi:hypothetical protein
VRKRCFIYSSNEGILDSLKLLLSGFAGEWYVKTAVEEEPKEDRECYK